ncbi:Hypothetical_protein [Hexamita inflata]|uniref:Hypothetical_protein n=1 Tax=Hexamita inflata TaxID=28002 RepID=A0AA86V2E8_9EUKA|nr:Hypothetical protein HINF_LOCUS61246 [Hexamita inflata]
MYTFNPRGLSLVIKQIDVIQLNNCSFALDQLIVNARDISLQNCDISGDQQQFICNNLHLCITGVQRIDWLRADKCQTILITINEFHPDFYKELATLSQIQNLNQLCMYDSTLDLQKIDVSLQIINLRNCFLQNQATKNFKVDQLIINESDFRTSQLIGANINKLCVSNIYDGTGNDFYFNYLIYYTILDDFPNLEYLQISDCIMKIKTCSTPVIQDLQYFGNHTQRVSLKFFKNIQKIVLQAEAPHLQTYQIALKQHSIIIYQNESKNKIITDIKLNHSLFIAFLKSKQIESLQLVHQVKLGYE